jgi:hypothetical protein
MLQEYYVKLLQLKQSKSETTIKDSIAALQCEIDRKNNVLQQYSNLKQKYKTILTQHLREPTVVSIPVSEETEEEFLAPFYTKEE